MYSNAKLKQESLLITLYLPKTLETCFVGFWVFFNLKKKKVSRDSQFKIYTGK